MATFTSPTDVVVGSLAKSSDINNLDAAVVNAFALLPTNASINEGTINFAVDTGIADAYLVSLQMTPVSYTDGMVVTMRPINTNTGACTINVNSIGVKTIKTENNSTPTAGDIVADVPIVLKYSSATGFFHISANPGAAATAAAASAAAASGSALSASSSAAAAQGAAAVLMGGATTDIPVGGGPGANPVWTAATGSGAPVRATSPSLVTPILGTPTSGTLTNCTGLPAAGLIPGTAENDFLVSGASPFAWVKKTLAEVKTILNVLLTQTSEAVGFTISGGTTSKTLTVTENATISGTPFAATDAIPSPGAYGETAPNTVRGKNVEIYKTASADSPLTAAQVSGTIVSNYGMTDADCNIVLPAAALGYSFLLILPAVRAKYFRITADGTDKIYLSGTAGSAGGYVGVASGYATGDCASFCTFKASDGGYDWLCVPIVGTWVAG